MPEIQITEQSCKPELSDVNECPNHQDGLLKTDSWASPPEMRIHKVGGLNSTLITSCQVMLILLVCGPHVRECCCKENKILLLRTHCLVLILFLSRAREHFLIHGLLSADPWSSITVPLMPHPFCYISNHVSSMGFNNPTLWCMAVTKGLKMDIRLSPLSPQHTHWMSSLISSKEEKWGNPGGKALDRKVVFVGLRVD